MKVYVYPADTTGCGWFRLLWPAQELIRQGYDITIMWPNDRGHFGARIENDVVKEVQYPKDADLIVVQRVSHKHLAQALGWIRSQGVAVVMDIDDDLSSIHPTNPAWALMHPKSTGTGFSTDHSWNYTTEAARNSTLTVVSSDALTRRYRGIHGARVLHNRVPDHYLDIPHEDSDLIGWGASILTHPDDGQEATTAVSRLVSEGFRFRMVGSGTEGVSELFGIPADKVDCAGPVPMQEWPNHLAQLGIGIAPLADTRFNAGKCIDADTQITTRRGVVSAEHLVVGDEVWRTDRWVSVEETEHDIPRPGVEVVTKDGYRIRLTPEHRMMVNESWVTADKIRPGDFMAMESEAVGPVSYARVPWPSDSRMSRDGHDPRAYLTAPDGPTLEITPRWGRFLGAFAGDGSAGQATALTISCDGIDQDWIDTLMSDFRSFGLIPRTEKITTFDGKVLRRRAVAVSSAHLLRVMESWGVVRPRDNGRYMRVPCVPNVIWESPRDVIAEFIAGYFEADGTVDGTSVSAISKDEKLIRDMQRLLLMFGIVSTVRARTNKAQNGFVGTYWMINLRRAAADVFAKEIGFRSERKSQKLEIVTSRPHSNAYRPMTWSQEVVSVTPCMVRPVDIQVDGSVFSAAGFVSHNSFLKPLEYAALGIPSVMSDRAEYRLLHEQHGIGVLVDRPKHWYRELKKFATDTAYRQDTGARNREIASTLTYLDHAWRWWEVWEEAVKLQRG